MRTCSRRALVSAALALSLSAAEGSAQSVQLPLDAYQVQGGFRNGDEQLPYSVYCGARPSCHHLGEDVSASVGTPVKAVADGVVIYSRKNRRGYGQYVVIAHTAPVPFVSIYAHLSRQTLYPMRGIGSVRRGDVIGYIGSKAENGGFDPHLHFGVYNSAHLVDGLFHYWGSAPNPDGDDVDIDPLGRPVGGRHTAPGAFIQALISQSTSVARPDAFTMLQGSSFASPAPGVPGVPGILDNDDVQGQLQSVEFIGAPAGLVVTDAARGFFVFTPAPSFAGLVTFTYRIVTTTGTSAPATITIQVNPLPTPPVARDDSGPGYSVVQGGVLAVPAPGVLGNDENALGATVEFLAPLPIGLTSPTSSDGSFTIDLTAHSSFSGPMSFQYQLRKGLEVSNRATVTVQVVPRAMPGVRLNWSVTPSGEITAMQVPPWSQGVTNFGWQFMMSRRAASANEWGATSCSGGAGGGYPVNLFQSPTDFISYNGGMNVFGMTGQDSLTRGGIGTTGCLAPGTYYFELSDLSSRQPDGGFTVNYFYEVTFDGSIVSAVGDGVGTLLPVSIAPDGIVSFTCPADYVNVGYESLSGQYPDSSTPVSTNTLGPIFSCNALGASTYTMEGGFLNETRPTPDGDYWVRISKYGTPFSVTAFNRDWIYWKARRQNGVWSVLP